MSKNRDEPLGSEVWSPHLKRQRFGLLQQLLEQTQYPGHQRGVTPFRRSTTELLSGALSSIPNLSRISMARTMVVIAREAAALKGGAFAAIWLWIACSFCVARSRTLHTLLVRDPGVGKVRPERFPADSLVDAVDELRTWRDGLHGVLGAVPADHHGGTLGSTHPDMASDDMSA